MAAAAASATTIPSSAKRRVRAPRRKGRCINAATLGRLGQPADIAGAVAFLCSPDGAYITGETLHVNGGMYMP